MNFTKADLKTGMVVTTRDRNEYIVMLGIDNRYRNRTDDVIVRVHGERGWSSLSEYDNELRHRGGSLMQELDIIKVEQPCHPYGCLDVTYDANNRVLLWEDRLIKESNKESQLSKNLEAFMNGELIISICNKKQYVSFMNLLKNNVFEISNPTDYSLDEDDYDPAYPYFFIADPEDGYMNANSNLMLLMSQNSTPNSHIDFVYLTTECPTELREKESADHEL